jgi:hypothetical protein
MAPTQRPAQPPLQCTNWKREYRDERPKGRQRGLLPAGGVTVPGVMDAY